MFVGFLIIATVIGKSVAAPYAEWAKGQIEKVKSILNSAREEHTRAVTDRIDSVGQLKEVVPLTQSLYAVAKETNQLEHENFILAQENAVKAELKTVLDSWVRYEQQQREAEQIALVKTVQANVEAELAKPAFKKQLLEEALIQVERECSVPDQYLVRGLTKSCRNRQEQGYLNRQIVDARKGKRCCKLADVDRLAHTK